jgi:hypothetical protein
MNDDLKTHFEAIHKWIEHQRDLPSPAPTFSPDERKQLHAVDRTISQLTKLGVSIPDDLRKLKLDLSAKDGSAGAAQEMRERAGDVRSLISELRSLLRGARGLRKQVKVAERDSGGRKVYGITVHELIENGYLSTTDKLELRWLKGGPAYPGKLHEDGAVAVKVDSAWKKYDTPSAAATDVAGRAINGWAKWRVIQADGTKVSLEEIRTRYIAERKKS